jgi:hypothetical protein
MEDEMSTIKHKLDSLEEEVKKEDTQLVGAENRISCLSHLLRLVASFNDIPKKGLRNKPMKLLRMKLGKVKRFGLLKKKKILKTMKHKLRKLRC